MKKNIYFCVVLFLAIFSTVSISHGSVLLKKKKHGNFGR